MAALTYLPPTQKTSRWYADSLELHSGLMPLMPEQSFAWTVPATHESITAQRNNILQLGRLNGTLSRLRGQDNQLVARRQRRFSLMTAVREGFVLII